MAWCCLFLGVLGVTLGFQLRVPPALQPKMRLAPRRVNTSKQWPGSRVTSSTMKEGEATAAGPVQAQEGSTHEEEPFDWAKQWYPVLIEKFTDTGRVHAVQLLAKDLVVWQNNEGAWAAFEDRCPHRAAPLTEGRVEKDGSLMCAYHGWRFGSDGKCLKIPQSENGGKDEAQAAACPKVYPTQVVQGMIWVWGDNGRDAGLESALTPAALVPELNDAEALESGKVVALSPYQRCLPYAWEILMENGVDPAHTVVAHHGIIGTRDMAAPIKIELAKSGFSKEGFSMKFNPPFVGSGAVASNAQFCAPSMVVVDNVFDDGSMMKFVSYGVPTRPGWCRVIAYLAAKNSTHTQTEKIIRFSTGVKPQHLPDWVQHLFGHYLLNQDIVLLHHQNKILDSGGYNSSNYRIGVFTPTGSDKGVLAMRKWIAKYAPYGPVWGEGCDTSMTPRERNRDELFNIYERHTKSCTSCLGALKRVKQLMAMAKASAAASFAWAILRGARAMGVSVSPSSSVLNVVTARAMLPGLATMFASLGAIKVLELIHKAFYTSGYHHQDNE